MAEAASPYPLLRTGKRRWDLRGRLRHLKSVRLLAAAILLAVLLGLLVVARGAEVDPRRALSQAQGFLDAGNYSAARDRALVASKAEPQSAAAQWLLARAYLELGDGSAADAVLTRAQLNGVAPARIRPYRAAARLLQGDVDTALALSTGARAADQLFARRVQARALAAGGNAAAAQRLLGGVPDAGAAADLGRIRFDIGDIGGAGNAAARALALDGRNPVALVLQAQVIRCRYGMVAALPWFEAALKRDPAYPPALVDYAATLAEAGRYRQAVAAAHRALAARPAMSQALLVMAVIAARAGNDDLARSMLQHAGGALDNVPAALLIGGAMDAAQGHGELAAAHWRELLDVQPDNDTVRRLMAAALLRSGDPHGALDMAMPIAKRGDADSYALEIAARAAWLVGNRPGWAALHDRAVSAQRGPSLVIAPALSVATLNVNAAAAPDDPSAALALIRGLIASGNVGGAIDRANALSASLPGTPAAQAVLGDALAAANRYADAATVYSRAANLWFDEATMLKLVDALGRVGRNADAARALALYAAQNPQSATALRIAGHWQVAAGEHSGAIVTLERARTLGGSRNAAVLADLALAFAGTGNGNVAQRYGRAAYALAPMNVAVVVAYAAALDAAGNGDGARQLRTKARLLSANSG